jgi:hypothetical protein
MMYAVIECLNSVARHPTMSATMQQRTLAEFERSSATRAESAALRLADALRDRLGMTPHGPRNGLFSVKCQLAAAAGRLGAARGGLTHRGNQLQPTTAAPAVAA